MELWRRHGLACEGGISGSCELVVPFVMEQAAVKVVRTSSREEHRSSSLFI